MKICLQQSSAAGAALVAVLLLLLLVPAAGFADDSEDSHDVEITAEDILLIEVDGAVECGFTSGFWVAGQAVSDPCFLDKSNGDGSVPNTEDTTFFTYTTAVMSGVTAEVDLDESEPDSQGGFDKFGEGSGSQSWLTTEPYDSSDVPSGATGHTVCLVHNASNPAANQPTCDGNEVLSGIPPGSSDELDNNKMHLLLTAAADVADGSYGPPFDKATIEYTIHAE